jgi:hypothetical protein
MEIDDDRDGVGCHGVLAHDESVDEEEVDRLRALESMSDEVQHAPVVSAGAVPFQEVWCLSQSMFLFAPPGRRWRIGQYSHVLEHTGRHRVRREALEAFRR